MQHCVRTEHHAVTLPKRAVHGNTSRATTQRSTQRAHKAHHERRMESTAERQMSVETDTATSTRDDPTETNIPLESSALHVTRRQVMDSAVTGSLVQGAVTMFPALMPPPSAAAPFGPASPPTGQLPPMTDSFGVATVHDPALYRHAC